MHADPADLARRGLRGDLEKDFLKGKHLAVNGHREHERRFAWNDRKKSIMRDSLATLRITEPWISPRSITLITAGMTRLRSEDVRQRTGR